MRRESTTVVAIVGAVDELLLADLGHSPNVAVVRAPTVQVGKARTEQADERPRWEAGAIALREAAHRQSAYALVADDPLADVAAAWRAMWDLAGGPEGPRSSRRPQRKRSPRGGESSSNCPTITCSWPQRSRTVQVLTCIWVRCVRL